MTAKRPRVDLRWDPLSDQPARALGPERQAMRRHAWFDYVKTAAVTGVVLPGLVAESVTRRLTPAREHSSPQHLGADGTTHSISDAIGIGISPLDHNLERIEAALDDLNCQHILVRFEWRRIHRWRELVAAIKRLNRPTLAVLVQDRAAVSDHARWQAGLKLFYDNIPPQIIAVQALQAVNRLKWGCANVGEALPLAALATRWHHRHAPTVRLIGSSVIDFEPLASLRSVISSHSFHYDAMAALLYVDRRGGPDQRQYGWFDLKRKIHAAAAIARCSPHVSSERLWLTEVNWPLQNTGKWAPTSQSEAVSEDDAARYLADYIAIAMTTGQVERTYIWQLAARGYGLIDSHSWRKRPAFNAVAELLSGQ